MKGRDGQLTDNDIIRAMECCISPVYEECKKCPLYDDPTCRRELLKDTLDLFKRQQAEIERLEAEVEKQYEQAEADILGNMADGGVSCHWCIAQHEANARKEFAKRLKAESVFLEDEDRYVGYAVKMTDLDNLLEEMEKPS